MAHIPVAYHAIWLGFSMFSHVGKDKVSIIVHEFSPKHAAWASILRHKKLKVQRFWQVRGLRCIGAYVFDQVLGRWSFGYFFWDENNPSTFHSWLDLARLLVNLVSWAKSRWVFHFDIVWLALIPVTAQKWCSRYQIVCSKEHQKFGKIWGP